MIYIGKNTPLLDAREKVTGKFQFASDFSLPGMLVGKILRSPHPHAKILSIDTRKAKRIPGVRVAVAGSDYDFPNYSVAGVKNVDDRILAGEKVRYIGDEVAAVAAVDDDAAEEAIRAVVVEYEELPVVFDAEKAINDDSVRIHTHVPNNIVNYIKIRHGDVEAGFEESDAFVEETFQTSIVHQAYLEPQAAIARWDSQGRLTLWIATQSPRLAQITYANALGIDKERIRIFQLPMGGAFGGKLEYKLHPICALLAREADAPVKMVNTRKEEFTAGVPRLPMKITMKLGCKKDGTLTGKQTRIIANCGAYVNYSQGIQLSATTRHDNLYRLKNIHTDSYLVYTNTIPKGCFRGFGCPQSFFALESLVDMLAQKINMDPAELRLKNASQKGDVTPHRWYFGSCGLSDAIRGSVERSGWYSKRSQLKEKKESNKAYGIGIACCLHVSGNRSFLPFFDGAAAYLRIDEEGGAYLSVGEPDIGQGSRTTFAMIVAHELSIPIDWVKVNFVDTDSCPQGLGTFGDRSTTLTGNAVREAAMDARRKVIELVANSVQADPSELEIRDAIILRKKDQKAQISFKEACQRATHAMAGGNIMGFGKFIPQNVTMVHPETKVGNISCAYPFVAQIAEVEVDLKTGEVNVLRFTAAHDLGKVINPLMAESQVHGAIAQGIGMALYEEMVIDGGEVQNTSFETYRVPRIHQMPEIETIFIESNDPNGPYGAKGLAEPALTPVAPAIANAIYHATGLRMTRLPITADHIKKMLNTQYGNSGKYRLLLRSEAAL